MNKRLLTEINSKFSKLIVENKKLIKEISFEYDVTLDRDIKQQNESAYTYVVDFGDEQILYEFYYDNSIESISISFKVSNVKKSSYDDYTNTPKNIYRKIGELKRGVGEATEHFKNQGLNVRGYYYTPSSEKRGRLYGLFLSKIFNKLTKFEFNNIIYLIHDINSWKKLFDKALKNANKSGKQKIKKGLK